MSVTMTKGDGVTVFTVASNQKSKWPLLCQMLGTMCYSPVYSVSASLRRLQGSSQSALGTIQIMAGLMTLGLAAILICTGSWDRWWRIPMSPFAVGGVFIGVGILCILTQRFPSQCLVFISVLVNLAGAGVAITWIVVYSMDLADYDKLDYYCRSRYNDYYDGYYGGYGSYRHRRTTATPTVDPNHYMEKCRDVKQIVVVLLNGLDVMLIALAALQLCVNISSAVLSVKSMCRDGKKANKNHDPEMYNSLLEVTTDASA